MIYSLIYITVGLDIFFHNLYTCSACILIWSLLDYGQTCGAELLQKSAC